MQNKGGGAHVIKTNDHYGAEFHWRALESHVAHMSYLRGKEPGLTHQALSVQVDWCSQEHSFPERKLMQAGRGGAENREIP
jgi:hypothetical protein